MKKNSTIYFILLLIGAIELGRGYSDDIHRSVLEPQLPLCPSVCFAAVPYRGMLSVYCADIKT